MIEVIVDGKTARENLFGLYHNTFKEIITPKNDEIREYCKFLKSYYPKHNKEVNYLELCFVMEIDNNNYEINADYSIIKDYENFLFEFPDDYPEEDLFYFKLKYC